MRATGKIGLFLVLVLAVLGASCAQVSTSTTPSRPGDGSGKPDTSSAKDEEDEKDEKDTLPFKLEVPPRRTRDSERAVLLELFTGAQCPPCVAADIAFDAVLKAYQPSEVIALQYHLHVPGPDPLTNPDSEAREEYYRVEGTPTAYLDGKETKESEPLGGPRSAGKESYDALRKQLDDVLKNKAAARIKLDVKREGDRIDMTAEVSELAKTGDRVRLRFVLVEDVVRYPARNGQRLHHHLVRSFPGGVKGSALLDTSVKKKATSNLADLKKSLNAYLDRTAKIQKFPDDNRPLSLKRLKVVAFIQDDGNKDVLQAAQADVPAASKN